MRNALILGLLFVTLQAGATVYYVRPTNGDNDNAGTSFAAAWQTTQYAIDNITVGDEIRLCAESTESPTATIDFDNTAQDVENPVLITGANGTDGSVDGTVYILSGSALPASSDLISAANGNMDYYRIQSVRFTAATRHNWNFGTNPPIVCQFYRCQFDSATGSGLNIETANAQQVIFVECELNNNGGAGAGVNTLSSRGYGGWYRCSVHDNTGNGIEDGKYILNVINCLIYDNGGDGLQTSSSYSAMSIYGNVFFGNSGDGWEQTNAGDGPINCFNNVFRLNGGYAINTNGGDIAEPFWLEDYNCFSNNTSGALDVGSIGANSITSDPKFTSETDGAEDFTPQSGSPLLGAGIDGGQW